MQQCGNFALSINGAVRSKACQSQTNGNILQEWKGAAADNPKRFPICDDNTKKTQKYLKIKIYQPEMKASIVNGGV